MVTIRPATKTDLPELLRIYTPYVEASTASFDEAAPTLSTFTTQYEQIQHDYPYLIAESAGELFGYCYAHAYSDRNAYQWSAEVTIYLKPAAQGQHVGTQLYQALEKQLINQNIYNVFACITGSNEASLIFHAHCGYTEVGHFKASGFKHGQWLDTIWMQKELQPLSDNQPHPFMTRTN